MTYYPTEHSEQCAFVERCLRSGYPYRLIAAVPNAAKRSVVAGALMKREGLRPGYPDLQLLVARGGYNGLILELKRQGLQKTKNGGLSSEQLIWIDDLRHEGFRVDVCYGQDPAWSVIQDYVQGRLLRGTMTAIEALVMR